MRKVFCLVLVLAAAASVNAVGTVPTVTATAPDATGGFSCIGWTGASAPNPMNTYSYTSEIEYGSNTFMPSNSFTVGKLAFQLAGYSSENIHISESTPVGTDIQARITLWEYTGTPEQLETYYVEPANQQTTPTLFTELGHVQGWTDDLWALDTESGSKTPNPVPGNGWFTMDMSSLGINLVAGKQYAWSFEWAAPGWGFDPEAGQTPYASPSSLKMKIGASLAYSTSHPEGTVFDPTLSYSRSKDAWNPVSGWTGSAGSVTGLIGDGVNFYGARANFVITPEPATIGLLCLGGLLLRRSKK